MFDEVRSILVVEDEPVDFVLLQRAFQRAGYSGTLQQAETADKAYRWILEQLDAKQKLPDIVMLDLNIPGESGMEILQKLKSTPELSGPMVIVYSGSANTRDMARARSLGADWYFLKKADARELDRVVRTLHHLFQEYTTGKPGS